MSDRYNRPINIDDVEYENLKDAESKTGISRQELFKGLIKLSRTTNDSVEIKTMTVKYNMIKRGKSDRK